MAVLLPARYGSGLRVAVCSRCIAHALVALFALDNETMTQPLLADYFPILVLSLIHI